MKLYKIGAYLGWASGLFAALMMLCGVILFFKGTEFLGVKYFFNFFFYSIPFMLFGIFLLVGTRCCCCCKDDKCCNDEVKG